MCGHGFRFAPGREVEWRERALEGDGREWSAVRRTARLGEQSRDGGGGGALRNLLMEEWLRACAAPVVTMAKVAREFSATSSGLLPAPLSPRYATVNPKNSFSLYQTASDTLGRRQGETTLQPNSLIIETHAPGRERAAHRQQLRTQRGGSVEWLTFEERGEGSGKR